MNEQQDSETDCRWLAYELHDGLLQWIIGARMNVDALLSQTGERTGASPRSDHDEPASLQFEQKEPGASARPLTRSQEQLSEILGNLESALEEGRELIEFLEQQDAARDVDFVASLASFVDRVQFEAQENQQTIEVNWADPPWPRIAARTTWNLLRLCQQALRNALQHAGRCEIAIECSWMNSDTLDLQIRDSGRGFELASADRSGHYGLASMRHRAKLIGAKLTIESEVGTGTTIRIELNTQQSM